MNFPTVMTLLMLSLAIAAPAADAQSLVDRRQQRGESGNTGDVSIDQAVQVAERRFNAKVVKVERVTVGERRVYQLRMLNSEGKVWTVRVDAATGQVL